MSDNIITTLESLIARLKNQINKSQEINIILDIKDKNASLIFEDIKEMEDEITYNVILLGKQRTKSKTNLMNENNRFKISPARKKLMKKSYAISLLRIQQIIANSP